MDPVQRGAAGMLCHITTQSVLASCGGRLTGQPFLHCCTEAQLQFVLARHFAGRTGLVVLRFDEAAVEGRIEWERSEPDQATFPHLFGALPVAVATADGIITI